MEKEPEVISRIGVVDKREIFQVLLSMTDRLLYLNKFPVDMEDFALSLQPIEIEDAWKLLKETNRESMSPSGSQYFAADCVANRSKHEFVLHTYPEARLEYTKRMIFMHTGTHDVKNARRHRKAVTTWCQRQVRLEDQLLRSAKAIKSIVRNCNTVGQYKRVSPDLLTFLPEKYRNALRNYKKGSPYPELSVTPEEIETMLGTLAYAALQPPHTSEEAYTSSITNYHKPSYNLKPFPRGKMFSSEKARRLQL